MEALQTNAITAVEQNFLLDGDERRRPAHDGSAARGSTRQHGLQVAVSKPSRRIEIVAVLDHGDRTPSGRSVENANLEAIIGAGGAVPFTGREIARNRGVGGGQLRWIAD